MVLIEEINRNIEWYRRKGKKYKKLSFFVRYLSFALFTAALLCMAFWGAGLATVICGVLGAAVATLDKVFNVTRNWVEFSYVEVSLASSVALIKHHELNGNDDAVLQEFREAMKKIEAETLGWQIDVVQGIRELKGFLEANAKST